MNSAAAVLLISALIILPQAGILAQTDSANGSIAMANILDVFGDVRAAACAFLFVAAFCAVAAVVMPRVSPRVRVLLLIPQQFALLVYASGALGAMMRESYADGVQRSWAFITADQVFLILTLAVHSIALGARDIG